MSRSIQFTRDVPDNFNKTSGTFWIMWRLLFALIVLYCLSSYYGSTFTSNPETKLYIKYLYVSAKLLIAGGIVSILVYFYRNSPRSTPQAAIPGGKRLVDPLLTLRAFACLLVLLGHYFAVVFPIDNYLQLFHKKPYLRLLLSSPWGGVWIFFTLSGYLMGKGFFAKRYELNGPGATRFLVNRALRILPVYVFCVLTVSILKNPEIFKFENIWNLIQILCFDFKGDLPIHPIGALWSVSTEFQFYLLAPFLAEAIFAVCKKRSFGFGLIAIILLTGLGLRFYALNAFGDVWDAKNWQPYVYSPLLANLDLFLCGMLLSKEIEARKEEPKSDGGLYLLIGILIMVLFYCAISIFGSRTIYNNKHFGYYMGTMASICCFFSLAVITLFERTNLIDAELRFPSLVKFVGGTQLFGVLTYCIYAVHEPVFLSIRTIAPKLLSVGDCFGYIPLVAGIVLLCAYTMYHLVELPFEKHKF